MSFRKLCFAALALCSLALPAAAQTSTAPAAPRPAALPAEAPDAVIKALYAAHMPSVQGKGEPVYMVPKLRARFFSAALARAIARDIAESKKTGEVGVLDFDLMTNSQDPEVKDLQVAVVGAEAGKARVEARFTEHDTAMVITYVLTVEGGAWRIFDILYKDDKGATSTLRGLFKLS